MRVETVAESFATYRAQVLPADASDVQVQECRRAFYAGAYFLLMGALLNIGDASTDEEDGIAQLEALKAECEAFAAVGGLSVDDPTAEAGILFTGPDRPAYGVPEPRDEPPMMAAQRIMREAQAAAGPLPPDIHHEAPAPLVADLRPVLERLGRRIGDDLPDGWGFALFLFSLGENGHTFYIANCDRGDVLTALHTFIKRQTS